MTNPYLGEIRLFGGNFAPDGWMMCDGQLLPIVGNGDLFNLLGTTFGGNGVTDFALPDFRARVAVGTGQGTGLSRYDLGNSGGAHELWLMDSQIPPHTHRLTATREPATTNEPVASRFAAPVSESGFTIESYYENPPKENMHDLADTTTYGVGDPHPNMMPTLAVTYIIAIAGEYPEP